MEQIAIITPTIGRPRELTRLIKSLGILKNRKFKMFVIDVGLEKPVERVVEKLKKEQKMDILCVSANILEKIKKRLLKEGFDSDFVNGFSVKGYSNARNFGLLLAKLFGLKYVAFIDDDEVMFDPDYLDKIVEDLGDKVRGRTLGGISGIYSQEIDEAKSGKVKKPFWKVFWDKDNLMWKEVKRVREQGALVETPIAFGGALGILNELYEKLPFDPWVTRGEDMAYAMYAKSIGYSFLLHSDLVMEHYHRRGSGKYAQKMRQDVLRFMYIREKLKLLKLSARNQGIYLRYFLSRGLRLRVTLTSILLAINALMNDDISEAKAALYNIYVCFFEAGKYAKEHRSDFEVYRMLWEKEMNRITPAVSRKIRKAIH